MKKIPPAAKPDFFSTQVSQARRFYFNLNPSEKANWSSFAEGLNAALPITPSAASLSLIIWLNMWRREPVG